MKFIRLDETLYDYVSQLALLPNPVLPALAEETSKMTGAQMQISRDQGAFMYLLTKLIGAKRCVEVGCFTGYSAICVASALPRDGRLITLDVNPETAAIAQRYFERAELSDRIELRLAPALETLPKLAVEYGEGSFDFAFIDADKENMRNYYEHCLKLVRPGGLIAVDNVLWSGRVVDKSDQNSATEAIRAFNSFAKTDTRVESMLATISDGIFLLRKK